MNITEKLKRLNNLLNYGGHASIRVTEDIYAMGLIGNLLHKEPYLPISSMALRPYTLAFLMNELTVNGRKHMIEFGAGMSTILLARLIKSNGLNAKITSVDENEGWTSLLKEMMQKEGLDGIIKLVTVPLRQRTDREGKPHWYDEALLAHALGAEKFDMVLVDGPTACNKDIEQSRYYAMPFLKERLAGDFAVFLDDADRSGEKKILQTWCQETGLSFTIFAGNLAVAYKGPHFICNPLKYVSEIKVGS